MTLYDFAKWVLPPVMKALFAPKITGRENTPPDGPLIVAANHRSYVDPLLLACWLPRTVHYMAKEELFKIPILATFIKAVNAFPVSRDEADFGSIRRALKILKDGGVVGIFPEGTRNVTGEARAKNGAVMLAMTTRCPVLPAALLHTDRARRLHGSHIEIRFGKPMTFQGSSRKATKAEIERGTAELARTIDQLAAG